MIGYNVAVLAVVGHGHLEHRAVGVYVDSTTPPVRAGQLCNKLVACEAVNGMDNGIMSPPPTPHPSSPTEPRDTAGGHRPRPQDRSSLD